MKEPRSVLVYGSGAVGSIFGWRLAQHSQTRVSVVCRSNFNRVKDSGFALQTTAWGSGQFVPHRVYPADFASKCLSKERFDYIICANKITSDYASTIKDLQGLVHPDTTLVSAQNGMDVELPLRQAFPNNTILTAICNIGCTQAYPGFVEQTAGLKPHAFSIGIHTHSRHGSHFDVSRCDTLAAMDAKFERIDCVQTSRWQKLMFNGAWNSTTALTGLDTHQVFQNPGAVELASQLANEIYRVAIASGAQLDEGFPARVISLARNSGAITPSTLQDARARRQMELAPIFGYIVSQGARVGTSVPHMTMVHDMLQQMNRDFRSPKPPHEATAYMPHHQQRKVPIRISA